VNYRCTLLLLAALWHQHSYVYAVELLDSRAPELIRQGQLWIYKGKPFTGEIRRLEDDGANTILPLQSGLVSGMVRSISPNGILRREGVFNQSMPIGLHRTWWPDGKKQSENNYLGGIPEGEARTWYSSGNAFEVHRYKMGQEFGAQKVWFDDGRLKANYEVRNGRRYGNFGAMGCIGGDKPKSPQFETIQAGISR
jgi:antitoxin component YwqK of YwqJK toxin-antitoxin module